MKLERINFGYSPDAPVLQDIHFEAKPSQRVALVGASGSGKTTLAQLIVGFYPVESGEISFNGVDVKNIGLDVVRKQIDLYTQLD